MYKISTVLMIAVFSVGLAGCAMPAQRTVQASTDTIPVAQSYWWYARYRITWPENTEPDWRVDLLLAGAVIRPVLDAHRQNIKYWRIHRRALRDGAGHQFSFIFYTDRETAGRIYAALTNEKLTAKLIMENILQKLVIDNLDNNKLVNITDTSDKNWSETLQNAWPAYIMGVSEMWLQLIEQHTADYAPAADTALLLHRYGDANDRISALWQNEGQHAFLHHLNAVFGYEPIMINDLRRF